MNAPSTLEILARRLSYAGIALLVAAAGAFVWAVGFTRGVDGLIEALAFTGLGLFLPAVATLWVSSVIASAAAANPRSTRSAVKSPARSRARWIVVLRGYGVALAAVAVAALIRVTLAPYLGGTAPYATFFLAVAIAAWAGGMGPGTVAAVITVVIVRQIFFDVEVPRGPTAEWIGAALFLTVALAIAGITSALRVARVANLALRDELALRHGEHDEQEARLREVADQAPAMLWWCGPDARLAYANAAWREYTGLALEDAVGDGWRSGLHPDDAKRWQDAVAKALRKREAFAVEVRRRHADGAYRPVREEARPRIVGDRAFAGYFGRTTEIAERGRAAAYPAAERAS